MFFLCIFAGLSKKIDRLAKVKECEDIGLWRQSIVNHLYYVAASTEDGNKTMIDAKWESLNNHVQNIHTDHNTLHPRCHHDPLDGEERDKQWLAPCKCNFNPRYDNIIYKTVCFKVIPISIMNPCIYMTYQCQSMTNI